MDELNQFLNSVEASARKILKQQNKKQQELLIRDRVALVRNGSKKTSNSTSSSNGSADSGVSRNELRATYGEGGSSLIIQVPSPRPHPVSPNGRRSEHASESEDVKYLPRLSGQSSGNEPPLRGSASANPFLPAIDRKQQQQKDGAAALEAAKRANREARRASSSLKILDSPLYKSLSKVKSEQGFGSSSSPGSFSSASPQSIKKAIHDVDNVNILLKKMGLREPSSSPSRRPDHAVERRMCNACWANPTKLTGCEHHKRVLSSNGSSNNGNQDPASIIQNLELQGPKSWLSDDLYVKYRSGADREALWDAFMQLKEAEKREQEEQQEALLQGGYSVSSSSDSQQQQNQKELLLKVIPIMTRHPIYHKFFTQIELENLRTQAETRKRNQSRAFVFDVNHIWLTNLDHFNDNVLVRKRRQQQRTLRKTEIRKHGNGIDEEVQDSEETLSDGSDHDDENPGEANSLSDRRDEAAICQGFSQIQSISTSRALQNAVFPEFDPSTSSFSTTRRQQTSSGLGAVSANNLPSQQQQQKNTRAKSKKRPKPKVLPLSIIVCGKWHPQHQQHQSDDSTDPLDLVPGLTLTGTNRVLWWRYPYEELENEDNSIELTKVVAMYARDATLSSSNAILVSVVLALDAPVLSQLWFAWHVGSRAPPPLLIPASPDASLSIPCCRVSPCIWSLVNSPLQSRIDSLMPCTMALLNNVALSDDHTLSLDDPYGHRRHWSMMNKDAFRQWWLVDNALPPDFDVTPQECSVQTAQPNATGVCGRFCWHSTDSVSQLLCRRRLEKDFVYIVYNEIPSGSNASMYFVVSMAHEVMLHVHAAKLATYLAMLAERQRKHDYEAKLLEIEQKLEVGRLMLEAKRQEQKRIEQELQASAVLKRDKIAAGLSRVRMKPDTTAGVADTKVLLQEWEIRMAQSVVKDEQGDWQRREITADDALVVFYHSLNQHLPPIHRYSWDRPDGWQEQASSSSGGAVENGSGDDNDTLLTARSDSSSVSFSSSSGSEGCEDGGTLDTKQRDNDEAMAQITRVLLEDEQFLQILKNKLGLSALEATISDQVLANALHKKKRKSSKNNTDDDEDNMDDEALQLDWDDQMTLLTEESDVARASLMATKMAKLQLLPPHKAHTKPLNPASSSVLGEGWKRLKNSKLPKNFARSVYLVHTEGPRSLFINQPNHATPVGMIDPAESSAYDPPEFFPELRTHFVPKANADLQEKKAIWLEYERSRPRILQPGTGAGARAVGNSGYTGNGGADSALDTLLEKDPAEAQMSMADRVDKAILCARNNNLEGLEDALDGGVDVNARDNYGNSLFILVCQQGNKRVAKFLLRRHADMNLQNMNGNTGLHYLYEYKHTELAEYLKAKGAVDTIQNASGLTCYEGLSADQLEQI